MSYAAWPNLAAEIQNGVLKGEKGGKFSKDRKVAEMFSRFNVTRGQ